MSEYEDLCTKIRDYIQELKIMANDDRISSESSIALKATELRYILAGRLVEIEEEHACAS